ncbi:Uncharacterised protein [Vibrio cholerae]|nr:Uncharacterised protein [Vibrio cholerae]CSC20745.1 Uncharacterised protein [Vibrio cholerae]
MKKRVVSSVSKAKSSLPISIIKSRTRRLAVPKGGVERLVTTKVKLSGMCFKKKRIAS